MGMKIGFDAERSGNKTDLLVIMNVRSSQKIGPHNLKNWTRFKKGND